MHACGLDFGTSNSAIGVLRAGAPTLVPVEHGASLIPSAVFFPQGFAGRILYGTDAISASVDGAEGRLMRALKTILGSSLINETTILGKRRVALSDVIRTFVRHLKAAAEDFIQDEIASVVHGRPVRFVDGDDDADAKAEAALESIAQSVGFRHVIFVFEPIAAACQYEATVAREECVLVADIGGGTADFSVIRIGPDRQRDPDRASDILANAGTRIGGTDFDTLLSLDAVMPLLGRGTTFIEKDLPIPNGLYFDLATWVTINALYTDRTVRDTALMIPQAREPAKIARLHRAIRDQFGHRIASAVEAAKMNLSDRAATAIDLGFLERGLEVPVARDQFDAAIDASAQRLHQTAAQCVADAGLRPSAIQTIFFTGGSSRVPSVRRAIALAAPQARPVAGSDLLSVAMGLTREAQRHFGG